LSPKIHRSLESAPSVEPSPAVAAVRHAAARPDRTAVVDAGTRERLLGGELAELSAALAAGLERRGIGRGDLVAVAMPSSVWWPVVALGVWRAGAAIVPLGMSSTADETGRLLARLPIRLTVASESSVHVVRGALSAARIDAEVLVHADPGASPCTPLGAVLGANGGGNPYAEPALDPEDLALVPFSSGVGGLPKGVRLTHGNLAAGAAQIATIFAAGAPFDADSVMLAGAPFSHALGLYLSLCAPLHVGARIVIAPGPGVDRTVSAMIDHDATHATLRRPTAPELAGFDTVEPLDSGALRFVATCGARGSAAPPLAAGDDVGAVVRQGYGTTEAMMISGSMGVPNDPETSGRLVPGVEARLIDPESGCDGEIGRPGELWVRGPQVTDGYYDDARTTAETITADGWLRTRALASIRPDGQLVVEGRLEELPEVDGDSVSRGDVELALREHPAVRDAAVIHRPSLGHGAVPVAQVVLSESATPEELTSFVSDRLDDRDRLRHVRVVEALPRLSSAKPERARP
jgi:acyl-CoA synthetase (AMP-forming)/AMP-acid ligase II